MTNEARWTIDTNVLIYATDPAAPAAKQRVARQLLTDLTLNSQACLVGQVLGEYMSVVIRKNAMSRTQALQAVHWLSQAATLVVGASPQAYARAWKLVGDHQYQVWDALIIAICAENGIETLYSEDAGAQVRPLGVNVVNPFREKGAP